MNKIVTFNHSCKNLLVDGKLHSDYCTLHFEKEYRETKTKDGYGSPLLISQSWKISTDKSLLSYSRW